MDGVFHRKEKIHLAIRFQPIEASHRSRGFNEPIIFIRYRLHENPMVAWAVDEILKATRHFGERFFE